MKKALWLLLIISAIGPSVNTFPKPAPQVGPRNCRIVDVTVTKAGEVDYVDGIKVPDEVGLLNFLRAREKLSPSCCLLLFVPVATSIRELDDFRVIAGKMQYVAFHVYVYESEYRDTVDELVFGNGFNSDDLRLSPRGPLPWPDRQPEKRK
jgi:hypothetical protein